MGTAVAAAGIPAPVQPPAVQNSGGGSASEAASVQGVHCVGLCYERR